VRKTTLRHAEYAVADRQFSRADRASEILNSVWLICCWNRRGVAELRDRIGRVKNHIGWVKRRIGWEKGG